jgi:hypothetical protein
LTNICKGYIHRYMETQNDNFLGTNLVAMEVGLLDIWPSNRILAHFLMAMLVWHFRPTGVDVM